VVPALTQNPPATDLKSTPLSSVVRLNRAPISNDILRVSLPKPTKVTLDNGLRVLILEDHRFPLVTTQLIVNGAGSLFEPAPSAGLAQITAQIMRQGTKTRTSKQLAEEIDRLGANINVSAEWGMPSASLNASGLSDTFDQWFGVAMDVLLHPNFPADELALLKQRQLVQLKQQRTQPMFLAGERLQKVLYGEHPAAVRSATSESLNALTPDMLSKWYADRYAPQNAILAIAGDVNANEIVPKLKKWMAEWKKTDLKVSLPGNPSAATAGRLFLVERPGSVQTNLLLGNLAVDRRDPDYVPLNVMNNIIGGGAAGRFFMNLRENKGYTYGAYSRLQAPQYVGSWVANSEVRSEVTGGALDEFFNEIRRINQESVPDDELQKAKRAMVARFALSLERPASVIEYAVTAEIYGFPADYWDKYPEQVMKVTAADVQRVAKKYLDPKAMQVVAVGDGTKIKTALEKFGTVTVYNSDGSLATSAGAAK
jgi:zinc protease